MSIISKIGNFFSSHIGGVQDKKVKTSEQKSDVKVAKKTNEDDLVETSDFQEENNSVFLDTLKTAGRIVLGVLTLGISELIRRKNENKEDKEYEVNGKIDKDIHQGQLGDCALISSIYSLGQTENGKEILKDAISINYGKNNKVKSYSVNFKGIDETVTIDKKELDNANDSRRDKFYDKNGYSYSKGDDDMLLLELAWQKLNEQAGDKVKNIETKLIMLHTDDVGPKVLNAVNYDKVLKALADIDYYNAHNIEEDKMSFYRNQQSFELFKKLDNMQEFKIADVGISDCKIYGHSNEDLLFSFNENDSYTARKDENSNKYIIKNMTDGKEQEFNRWELIDRIKVPEDKQINFRKDAYLAVKDSNPAYMVLSGGGGGKVKTTSGEEKTIIKEHAYGIKKITDDKIVFVNPWNTSEEIECSLDEIVNNPEFSISYGKIK